MEIAKLDRVMNNHAVTDDGGGRFHGVYIIATEVPVEIASKTHGLFDTEIWKFVKSRYIVQKTSSEETFAMYEMFPRLREAIVQWNRDAAGQILRRPTSPGDENPFFLEIHQIGTLTACRQSARFQTVFNTFSKNSLRAAGVVPLGYFYKRGDNGRI
jgi:hypothetical protein